MSEETGEESVSEETPDLQKIFNNACNQLDRMIGKDYQTIIPRASKNFETGITSISLSAKCRTCPHLVMAAVTMDMTGSAEILVSTFLRRAQFHTKKHNIIYKIPGGRLRTI